MGEQDDMKRMSGQQRMNLDPKSNFISIGDLAFDHVWKVYQMLALDRQPNSVRQKINSSDENSLHAAASESDEGNLA